MLVCVLVCFTKGSGTACSHSSFLQRALAGSRERSKTRCAPGTPIVPQDSSTGVRASDLGRVCPEPVPDRVHTRYRLVPGHTEYRVPGCPGESIRCMRNIPCAHRVRLCWPERAPGTDGGPGWMLGRPKATG